MKITLLLLSLCLAISLGSAVWIRSNQHRHLLINRPKIDTFGAREKRSAWASGVKGVKGQKPLIAPPSPLELNLRKGEYVCGNRICKLQPGVEPKGCNGLCQYPV